MTDSEKDRPDWWLTNERIKSQLGLPKYDPPKFADETYVYKIVDRIERERDCSIQFGAINPRYPDDWYVWIDGEQAFSIGRQRTIDANTMYKMTAEEFCTTVETYVETEESDSSGSGSS